jgi:extradiol dioxygenase family protein
VLAGGRVEFVIEPHVRYAGKLNEQASMIFRDPSGNVIELKSFADPARMFAT